MKYRHDITIDIWVQHLGYKGKPKKDYKVYQHTNGLLYGAEYELDNPNKISHYSHYSLFGVTDEIKDEVTQKYRLPFAEKDDKILCRCGEHKFTAFYGSYELNLECVICLHQFTAYSG